MTEVAAKRVEVDGNVFDSVLEADWWVTLREWGFEVTHHPGRVPLKGGAWYEPDFLVKGRYGTGDVLLEVKGDHDERVWKPALAEEMYPDLGGVVILRKGLVVPGTGNETAGAVWHSTTLFGPEWAVVFRFGHPRFTCDPDVSIEDTVFVSAERALTRPPVYGLEMKKATWTQAQTTPTTQ